MTFSVALWNTQMIVLCFSMQGEDIIEHTEVETPYHDNNLILTPIISPQSGW
jgi:hypothetical protein